MIPLRPKFIPATAADPGMTAWAARVQACGSPVRPGACLTIEGMASDGSWLPIMLPCGGRCFASVVERDKVLVLITSPINPPILQ